MHRTVFCHQLLVTASLKTSPYILMMPKVNYRPVELLSLFVLYCTKICALIFLNYDPKTKRMKDSKKYSILIIIPLVIQSAIAIRSLYSREIAKTNHTITKLITTFTYETVSLSIIIVGIYATLLSNRRQCKLLINQGLKLYANMVKLEKMKVCRCDKKFVFCIIYTAAFGCFAIFSLCTDYIMSHRHIMERPSIKSIVFFNFFCITFIYALVVVVFVSVMLFSAHSLRLVNSRIQKCFKVILTSPKMSECCELSEELDYLHDLYTEIIQFTHQVSKFYSFPLLLAFVTRFIAAVAEVCIHEYKYKQKPYVKVCSMLYLFHQNFYIYIMVKTSLGYPCPTAFQIMDTIFWISTLSNFYSLIYATNKVRNRVSHLKK